jgi:hypothetical protein
MKGRVWEIVLGVWLTGLVFVLTWMHRYEYHSVPGARLVRINRFSTQQCYLQADGTWDSRPLPPIKTDSNIVESVVSEGSNKCQ